MKKNLKKDRILQTLLDNICNDALAVSTQAINDLFADTADKDALFFELMKMEHLGLIKLNRTLGNKERYNIFSLQVTQEGLAYFDNKREEARLSRQQLRYAIISGSISSLVGAVLGWGLSVLTLG